MLNGGTSFSLEIIQAPQPTQKFRAALFDLDGTLSLIREGWPTVMLNYFLAELETASRGRETSKALTQLIAKFIGENTGKPTIYQCISLADEITLRGGKALDPQLYLDEYTRRLHERTRSRIAGLSDGSINPDSLIPPGGREFLQKLHDAGFELYLASGTNEEAVKREVGLLGLSSFFNENVYGSRSDDKFFTKATVIENMLKDGLSGAELVGFGDGSVETKNVRAVGGYAVGMATNESRPGTGVDADKRQKLLESGANAIVPDYGDPERLFRFITGESS